MRAASPPMLSTILEHEEQRTAASTAAHPASTISSANATGVLRASRDHVSLPLSDANSHRIDVLSVEHQRTPDPAELVDTDKPQISVSTSIQTPSGAALPRPKPNPGNSASDAHQAKPHLAPFAAVGQVVGATGTLVQPGRTASDSEVRAQHEEGSPSQGLPAVGNTIAEEFVPIAHVDVDIALNDPQVIQKPVETSTAAAENTIREHRDNSEVFGDTSDGGKAEKQSSANIEGATESNAVKHVEQITSEDVGGTDSITHVPISSTVIRAAALHSTSTPETTSAPEHGEMANVESSGDADEENKKKLLEEPNAREDSLPHHTNPTQLVVVGGEDDPMERTTIRAPIAEVEADITDPIEADTEDHAEVYTESNEEAQSGPVASYTSAEYKMELEAHAEDGTRAEPDAEEHSTAAGKTEAENDDSEAELRAAEKVPSSNPDVSESEAVQESSSALPAETTAEVPASEELESVEEPPAAVDSKPIDSASEAIESKPVVETSAADEIEPGSATPTITETTDRNIAAPKSLPAESPSAANEADQAAEPHPEVVVETRAVEDAELSDCRPARAVSGPAAEHTAAVEADTEDRVLTSAEPEHVDESLIAGEADLRDDAFEGAESAVVKNTASVPTALESEVASEEHAEPTFNSVHLVETEPVKESGTCDETEMTNDIAAVAESAHGQESFVSDEVGSTALTSTEKEPDVVEGDTLPVDTDPAEKLEVQSRQTEEPSTIANGYSAGVSSKEYQVVSTEPSSVPGESEYSTVSAEIPQVDPHLTQEHTVAGEPEQEEERNTLDETEQTVETPLEAEQVVEKEPRVIDETERSALASESQPKLAEAALDVKDAQPAKESTPADESSFTDEPLTGTQGGAMDEGELISAENIANVPEAEHISVISAGTVSERSVVNTQPSDEPIDDSEAKLIEEPSAVPEEEPAAKPVENELPLGEEPYEVAESEPAAAVSAETAAVDAQGTENPVADVDAEPVQETSTVPEEELGEVSRALPEAVLEEESASQADEEPTAGGLVETEPELVNESCGLVDVQPVEEPTVEVESKDLEEPSNEVERGEAEGASVGAIIDAAEESNTVTEAEQAVAASAETESELVEEQGEEAEVKEIEEAVVATEANVGGESRDDVPTAVGSETVQEPDEVVRTEATEAEYIDGESEADNNNHTAPEFVDAGDVGHVEGGATAETGLNELTEIDGVEDHADDESKAENGAALTPAFVEDGDVGDGVANVSTSGMVTADVARAEDEVEGGKELDGEVAEVAETVDATEQKHDIKVEEESYGERLEAVEVVGEGGSRGEAANATDGTETVEDGAPSGQDEGEVEQYSEATTAEAGQASQLQLKDREFEVVESMTGNSGETVECEHVAGNVSTGEEIEESNEESCAAAQGAVSKTEDSSNASGTEGGADGGVEGSVTELSVNTGDGGVGDSNRDDDAGMKADIGGMVDGGNGGHGVDNVDTER